MLPLGIADSGLTGVIMLGYFLAEGNSTTHYKCRFVAGLMFFLNLEKSCCLCDEGASPEDCTQIPALTTELSLQ